ncbi:MAG: ABC transporter substrate-binding protein [Actinomycetota bacterium]|nr:ABC transporter substrate-binding protein [Actinomycetota bacterium]
MGYRRLSRVLALLLAASCITQPQEPTTTAGGVTETSATTLTTAGATTTSAAAAPSEGATLVVAIDSDPGHLNPAITTSGSTHTASELLYNGLVDLGPDLEPLPELAESWDVEEDGALYRFHLRDDVTWHDGTPFTSADVQFSFEEVLLELHSRTAASVGTAIESIQTPDDHTVEFRFRQPYAPLLRQLNVTEAPIVARHVYEGSDLQENPANTSPVGTGPFQFVSYSPEAEIVLDRNPDYFKEDLPHLGQVVMRIIPDEGSRVIAFEAGEVDWLWGVPGSDLARLQADPNVEFIQTAINPGGQNCITTISYNLERPMMQDLRVRRAIAHALDRDQFVERVLFGEGRVAAAPIHSGIAWAHATGLPMPEQDPAEAQRLLEEAGWTTDGGAPRTAQGVEGVPDGTPLAFNFLHFPTFAAYGELLRAQLAQVGMEVTLQPLDPPVFVEAVFTERDFDTNIISYCNGTDPEIGVRRMYISGNIAPMPFSNSSAYRNEQVDRLFDQAQRTVGLDARGEIYRQIQEIVVEELPYFWVVEPLSTRAYRSSCSGFKPSGHFAETAICEQ